ncbi:CIA30 family protein [Vibrio sp. WXL103]|uniref:CIA30 family protein n=1 Tax=unclassified Vibrio TaxID=2614977 RepID=UPI003EC51C33
MKSSRPNSLTGIKHLCFFLIAFAVISLLNTTTVQSMTIDLTQPDEYLHWQAVNDNVMGGISVGSLRYQSSESVFDGELSLANNGGFSSVSRPLSPLPTETDQVEVSVIGDGRTYQMRLTTLEGGVVTRYKHEFATIKGQQQVHKLHFDQFQAVFRGRLLPDAPPLKASQLNQVGVLIADKFPGAFKLRIIQIQFNSSRDKQ